MTNRYLTHLGITLLMHLLMLVGCFSHKNLSSAPKVLDRGPSILKLKVISSAVIGQTFPQIRKNEVSKSVPSVASNRPLVTPKERPQAQEQLSSAALGGRGAVEAGARDIFKAELRAEIERNKSYPPMSRRLGQSGTVVVAFTLLEDGHIIDVRLDTPSRYERLNDSALEAVKKVHKFKPIPSGWNEARMDITVPVKFIAI